LNEAIATYKEIIEMDSTFAESYFNIGYIYLELLKVNDMAVPYFTKAIKVKPQYKQAYYNRALAFEEVGNVMQAKEDYEAAIKIDPDYVAAILGLQRIEKALKE
jgi:tetratricopeptide (TPR) repeat protein